MPGRAGSAAQWVDGLVRRGAARLKAGRDDRRRKVDEAKKSRYSVPSLRRRWRVVKVHGPHQPEVPCPDLLAGRRGGLTWARRRVVGRGRRPDIAAAHGPPVPVPRQPLAVRPPHSTTGVPYPLPAPVVPSGTPFLAAAGPGAVARESFCGLPFRAHSTSSQADDSGGPERNGLAGLCPRHCSITPNGPSYEPQDQTRTYRLRGEPSRPSYSFMGGWTRRRVGPWRVNRSGADLGEKTAG